MVGRIGGLVATLACLTLVVAACGEQSRVDPTANVRVHGSLRAVDGTPLDARPVRLGSGVSDLEGGAGVLTVGLFCLTGGCTGEFFDTTTGDDGSYAFELAGQATRSSFGEALSFLLSTADEPTGLHPTGPAVAARFRIQSTDLALPELQLVDPELQLRAEGHEVDARWDASVAAGPYSVTFVAEDDTLVWDAGVATGQVRLDGRILEDLRGRAFVAGERRDRIEGSDLAILWQSSSVAFHGGFGAPPSRGSDCALIAADGTEEPLPNCGLTDGAMTPTGAPGVVCPSGETSTVPAGGCPPASRLRVTLRTAVASDLVVVRGCRATCNVWTTPEGTSTAVHAGAVTGPHGTVGLDGRPVTAVEVEITDAPGELAEISVWAPVAAGDAPLRPVDDPQRVGVLGGDSRTDPDRTPWVVAAIAAAAMTLVGAGVLLGRRMAS